MLSPCKCLAETPSSGSLPAVPLAPVGPSPSSSLLFCISRRQTYLAFGLSLLFVQSPKRVHPGPGSIQLNELLVGAFDSIGITGECWYRRQRSWITREELNPRCCSVYSVGTIANASTLLMANV
ncbi:hypothetical protein KQX54_019332 [Cotesia glomerata]|uniref:Uncharacterized protein n=1 Tax=Cotesia glomerata TaxID=32391 RepID=A0AAV7I481_COTGL|nr:hypothetical protein KQX54_019332 [Cotesia glomerata]